MRGCYIYHPFHHCCSYAIFLALISLRLGGIFSRLGVSLADGFSLGNDFFLIPFRVATLRVALFQIKNSHLQVKGKWRFQGSQTRGWWHLHVFLGFWSLNLRCIWGLEGWRTEFHMLFWFIIMNCLNVNKYRIRKRKLFQNV